jgi:hypothetical protein
MSWYSVASADVLDVDLSGATVGGQVPVTSQFLPDVEWINFYVDGEYATSTGGSAGSFTWNSSTVADGVHDLEALGFDADENVSGYTDIRISVANATPSASPGSMAISGYADRYVGWINLYVDGSYAQSTGSGSWSLSQSFNRGTHQIGVGGFAGNDVALALVQVGSVNFGGIGAAPTWSVSPGATIAGLTGSAANISGADTNPGDYGQYNAPGGFEVGYGLIGGPLLNDQQAASFVVATPRSDIELSLPCHSAGIYWTPNGSDNAAANNYFNNIAATDPGDYQYQLSGFYTAYVGSSWQAVADRIDGACPMANPTTAEVLQWAGNKWGVNPLLMYAGTSGESEWDQTSIGDNGQSSGLFQIADRGATHAFPGFSGSGSMLARENSCFNADFYAAYMYAAFNGLIGGTGGGNIGTAVQSWGYGPTTSPGGYSDYIFSAISTTWWAVLFDGIAIPY